VIGTAYLSQEINAGHIKNQVKMKLDEILDNLLWIILFSLALLGLFGLFLVLRRYA